MRCSCISLICLLILLPKTFAMVKLFYFAVVFCILLFNSAFHILCSENMRSIYKDENKNLQQNLNCSSNLMICICLDEDNIHYYFNMSKHYNCLNNVTLFEKFNFTSFEKIMQHIEEMGNTNDEIHAITYKLITVFLSVLLACIVVTIKLRTNRCIRHTTNI